MKNVYIIRVVVKYSCFCGSSYGKYFEIHIQIIKCLFLSLNLLSMLGFFLFNNKYRLIKKVDFNLLNIGYKLEINDY